MKILLIDDDPMILDLLTLTINRHRPSWKVLSSLHPIQGLELLRRSKVDAVISDLELPGMYGSAVLRRVRKASPEIITIMHSSVDAPPEDLIEGNIIDAFFKKPYSIVSLIEEIETLHTERRCAPRFLSEYSKPTMLSIKNL
ncbi:MAG: response regulator [Candidatus Dadabacteria bacterium]|nr:MAG: response regulator [Candidatus Dadabacteria bacterium]